MNRTLLLAGIAFIFIALVAVKALFIPESIEDQTRTLLYLCGFPETNLSEAQEENDRVSFKNIKLDENGFGTIGEIQVTQNWRGIIDTITLKDIRLTGEANGPVDIIIAGWQPAKALPRRLISGAPRSISIENARLSLLTPTLGGLDLTLSAELRKNGKAFEVQANIRSSHPDINFSSRLNGTLSAGGFWQGELDLEQAKFDFDALKASRMSGTIQLSGQTMINSDIVGELQAGALTTLELPWQNAALGVSGSLATPSINISAKSAGVDGLELGLELADLTQPSSYILVIHTDTLGNLIDVLNARNALPFAVEDLAPIEGQENYDFIVAGTTKGLSFEINRENTPVIVNGEILPQAPDTRIKSLLDGEPFNLSLQTRDGVLKGALYYDPNTNRMMILPEQKPLRPKLNPSSELIDIFR